MIFQKQLFWEEKFEDFMDNSKMEKQNCGLEGADSKISSKIYLLLISNELCQQVLVWL